MKCFSIALCHTFSKNIHMYYFYAGTEFFFVSDNSYIFTCCTKKSYQVGSSIVVDQVLVWLVCTAS